MNYSKVKQHFSIFMIKKSIKIQKSEDSSEPPIKKKVVEEKTVQKFLDPIQSYHLYNDFYFQDKINSEDAPIFSVCNGYKAISDISFSESTFDWRVNVISLNFPYESWQLIHDRLETLGDRNAYDLAETIKSCFLGSKKYMNTNEENPIEGHILDKEYLLFLKKFEDFLKTKKSDVYFYGQYRNIPKKGLVSLRLGMSTKMTEICFGDNAQMIDQFLNFGIFDFLTVERELYFEYMRNAIHSFQGKPNSMRLKLMTNDGFYEYVSPKSTPFFYLNEKGEILEMYLFYELEVSDDFYKMLQEKRMSRTRIRKKMSRRDHNLAGILSEYYKQEEFFGQKKNGDSDDEKASKRCGFRNI